MSASPSDPDKGPCPVTVLTQRRDFLKAARARYKRMPGLILQARKRSDNETATGIRVGFTCSKKVGNAVARNRAKRRLREAARVILPQHGETGWDYVLIGLRDATAERPFMALQGDLEKALGILHSRETLPVKTPE